MRHCNCISSCLGHPVFHHQGAEFMWFFIFGCLFKVDNKQALLLYVAANPSTVILTDALNIEFFCAAD